MFSTFRFLILPILSGVVFAGIIIFCFPQIINPGVSNTYITDERLQPVHSYNAGIAKASPSVVNIFSNRIVRDEPNPFWEGLLSDPYFKQYFAQQYQPSRERIESSLGSGVILTKQGHILTNNHVIVGADVILVALADGRELSAEIIGTDPGSDLAVLKIEAPNLVAADLQNQPSNVGDVVFAIGNPFGVGQTVTMGIISATGRNQLGVAEFEDFIQTDAAINPGNSGGALVDTQGKLVGINTAVFSIGGGISFVIPTHQAVRVLEQILSHGQVIRGYVGASMNLLTPSQMKSFGFENQIGLVVTDIAEDSPAMEARLQPGDIIVEIAGLKIQSSLAAQQQVTSAEPGDELEIKIIRNGEVLDKKVRVGVRPSL